MKICLLLVTFASPLSAAVDQTVLGVLEKPQCKKEHKTSARLLFVKTGKLWVALNSELDIPKNFNPTQPDWTIAFDGRKLGSVKLLDPNPVVPAVKEWYYGRDKLYEPKDIKHLPTVKNESKSFVGWCDVPIFRPLALMSQANFSDPDKWKPFSPEPSYKKRLLVPLKLVVGRFKAVRCVKGERHPEPWNFTSEDLILNKSFRAASGQELVSIGIDLKKYGCDGPPQPEWSGNWFLLGGEKVEFLGKNMELVDAGDYDKDGRSELLFWYSAYNRDGYVLVYDGLRRKVEYLWGYH